MTLLSLFKGNYESFDEAKDACFHTIKSILKKFISSCVYAVYFLFSYYKSILKAKKFSLVYSLNCCDCLKK